MLDLRKFKKAIVSYGMHSPFLKQMSSCNEIIPRNWRDFAKAVLQSGPQLKWRNWFKEKNKSSEQQSRARGMEIFQDQLLGEGDYADVQRQSLYSNHKPNV